MEQDKANLKSGRTIFVIGGCRSGKSRHAIDLAESMNPEKPVFIATCVPGDEEMADRVEKHQQERGRRWTTIEAPLAMPEAISENSSAESVVVVDCLTLWISNLMTAPELGDRLSNAASDLVQSLESAQGTVILVSNEVGAGIVPENRMAREFRDLAGRVNQAVAACADQVEWMVAGIPVSIKPETCFRVQGAG